MAEDFLTLRAETESADIISLTSEIVSAYVGNNSLNPSDLPDLIRDVHSSLASLHEESSNLLKQKPAVAIAESIQDEYLVCLEDGRQFKSLRRHLRTKYGLTPEQYREKWGLPFDYPMVAPAYARQRSKLAKEMGLGQSAGD